MQTLMVNKSGKNEFWRKSLRPLDSSKDSKSDYRLRFAIPPKLNKLQGQSVY